MDALSLSHLTYCCATITVNFHRLDHPPFPCKSRLLRGPVACKCTRKGAATIHLRGLRSASELKSRSSFKEERLTHESSNHCWNSPHRPWDHRIRYRRTLLYAREESCRRRTSSNIAQDPGHASTVSNSEHCLLDCRIGFSRGGSKVKVNQRGDLRRCATEVLPLSSSGLLREQDRVAFVLFLLIFRPED
jgi:hypothetical protein